MERKKLPVTLTAVISAVAVLLSGTLAWQSVSPTALNEASDIVNPGGRLHDDFDGQNKDIYVENFADEPILARIQLGEFLALTHNKGVSGAERENILIGGTDESGQRTYEPHIFGGENASDAYWTWRTGGQSVYMPTFNRNKDSLAADVNGTYFGLDGTVTDRHDDDRYADYIDWSAYAGENGTTGVGATKTDNAIYDADSNDVDEVQDDFTEENLSAHEDAGHIGLHSETHTAKPTLSAQLIRMDTWLAMTENGYDPDRHGHYWVYDADGWCYWSAAIQPYTATGLLLDEIRLSCVMDDSWYYAIQVTAQFVTPDDIGKSDSTGFYEGTQPTPAAETLLERITATLH